MDAQAAREGHAKGRGVEAVDATVSPAAGQAPPQRAAEVTAQGWVCAQRPEHRGSRVGVGHVGIAEAAADAQQVAQAKVGRGTSLERAAECQRGHGRVMPQGHLCGERPDLFLVLGQP